VPGNPDFKRQWPILNASGGVILKIAGFAHAIAGFRIFFRPFTCPSRVCPPMEEGLL